MEPTNPFVPQYDSDSSLLGREAEQEAARVALETPAGRIALVAPRRMGLSTLLQVVTNRLRSRAHVRVAYAQLDVAVDSYDAGQRLFSAVGQALGTGGRELLVEAANRFGPPFTVRRGEAGDEWFELRELRGRARDFDTFRLLQAVNDALERRKETLGIVVDDFGALLNASNRGAWSLKAAVEQHHRISYVFGSTEGAPLMARFQSPESGLWRAILVMELQPIPRPVLVAWLMERFGQSGRIASQEAIERLVGIAGPRTGDVVGLAGTVWARAMALREVAPDDIAGAQLEMVRNRDSQYLAAWRRLTTTKRRILTAMVTEQALAPTSTEAMRRFHLGPKSSVHRAVHELLQDATIVRQGDSEWLVDDPFFGEWIRGRVISPVAGAKPPGLE